MGRLARRRCYYCGATRAEAAFPGNYKPRGQRDRCASCIADPLRVAKARVQARRDEIAALQARANGYRAPRPVHSLPLFARPPGVSPETPVRNRANTARASDGSRGPGQSPESPIINEDI